MKATNLKNQLRRGIKSLNHLMYHTLYQVFQIILVHLKKHVEKTNNRSIKKYIYIYHI